MQPIGCFPENPPFKIWTRFRGERMLRNPNNFLSFHFFNFAGVFFCILLIADPYQKNIPPIVF